ncbi:MAG TPA: RNA polymerase sigma factor region1.1 domain-containing protein, partial [bacterium]|nr:RNA polymerase sigma factor region1.1 domain-containing protein [bacterium]
MSKKKTNPKHKALAPKNAGVPKHKPIAKTAAKHKEQSPQAKQIKPLKAEAPATNAHQKTHVAVVKKANATPSQKQPDKKKSPVANFVPLDLSKTELDIEERLQQMLEVGRERGFLTYEELNINIPENVTNANRLDEILCLIEEVNIQIVEDPSDFKPEKIKKVSKAVVEESTADAPFTSSSAPQKMFTTMEGAGSSNDPVRMYLRKMGSVSLLTREGEVEVAKRIEHWEHKVFEIIL